MRLTSFLPYSGMSAILRLAMRGSWRAFESAALDPEQAQKNLWSEIVSECAGSPFWKKHCGSGAPPPLEELPITEYEDYRPEFEAAFEKGHSPTTASPVKYWASTSGTTGGKFKYFPYIAMSARQGHIVAGAYEAAMHRLSVVRPHIPFKPMLTFSHVGSRPPSPTGIPVGSATSYYQRFLSPRAHRMMHVIPWEVYEQTESGLFRDWAPLYALTRDVSMARSLTAGWITLFFERLLADIESYWPYLEGRAQPPAPLPPVEIGRRRLRHLHEVFGRGTPTLTDVWPGLAAAMCWTTASAALQVPKLLPHLGKAPLLDTPYGCVEGLLNVPLHDGKDGHPLHPGANIVELLPEDEEAEPGNLIPSWKAEKGQRYEIFLTTLSGLARYRLHDIVQCMGHYHRAPRIVFCCKSAFVLKVTSTVIPENDLVSILLDLGYRGHEDLLAGPSPSGASVAVYLRESSGQSLDVEALDNALRKISRMYAHERNNGLLGDIESYVVPDDHAMWEWRNRPPAKERYILNEAPSGVF